MDVREALAALWTRRVRWVVFPTSRLALVVLAVGVLWLIPGSAAGSVTLAAIAIVAGVVAFDYIRLPSARDIDVERIAPETMGLGDDLEFRYIIRSSWPWSLRAQLFDQTPAGIAATVPD